MGILIKEVSRLSGEGTFGTIEIEMFESEGFGKLFLSKELERGTLMLKCGDTVTKKEFFGDQANFTFPGISKDYSLKIFESNKEILSFSTTGDFSEKLNLEHATGILANSSQISEKEITDAFEGRVSTYNYYDETMLKIEPEKNMVFNLTSSLGKNGTDQNEPLAKSNAPVDFDKTPDAESAQKKSDSQEPETMGKTGKSFKKQSFFETVKEDIDKLFQNFPSDEFLENLVDNSRWVKVQFDEDHSYSVGLIYADDRVEYIGYGIIGTFGEIPKELSIATQFLPLDFKCPQGEGYHLVYQRADNGDSVK